MQIVGGLGTFGTPAASQGTGLTFGTPTAQTGASGMTFGNPTASAPSK